MARAITGAHGHAHRSPLGNFRSVANSTLYETVTLLDALFSGRNTPRRTAFKASPTLARMVVAKHTAAAGTAVAAFDAIARPGTLRPEQNRLHRLAAQFTLDAPFWRLEFALRRSRVSKLRFHNTTHPLLGYGAYTPEKGS